MIVELKKGYIIDSYYDKNTRSYITTLKDENGNQVRDAYYSGNMTDRNADIQFIKEFFYKYTLPSLSEKNISYESDEEVFEESLEDKIKNTKKKTKKTKLPALSTLSPIIPDAAAGIETFNSGVGLSEEYLNRDELIYRLKRMGFKYKYDKYNDKQLYKIYQERKAALDKRAREKAEKEKKQRTIDRMIDKLEQVDYDEGSDTYSDGNYYKNGIEFESEDAAREYFGESMDRNYHWDVDTIIRIIKQAWKDAGLILREDRIDISRHDNWCFVEIKYIDNWDFKHINKPMIKKALKKELDLYDVKQSSWKEDGWGSSDYGKTLRYDLYMYPPEEKEIDESLYLNDMHEAWDIEEDDNHTSLNESLDKKEKEFKTINESLKYFERKAFNESSDVYELETLYESIKEDLDSSDIKKLRKFINKADNAEEITTYIKGLLTEEVDNFDINKYYKLAEDISNYASKEYDVWQNDVYDVSKFGDKVEIKFYVKGDWKHDHLRFEHALGEFIRNMKLASSYPEVSTYDFWEEEIDSNDDYDSDYYPAIHVLSIELENDIMKESLYNESCDGWIAFYQGKKLEIPKSEVSSIYDAKQKAIKELKIPKSKMGMLAIKPAYNESFNESVENVTVGLYGGDETFSYPEDFYSFIDKCKKSGLSISNDTYDGLGNWELELTGNGDVIYKISRDLPGYYNSNLSPNEWISEYRIDESLNEDFVEEWWGQVEESPYDFANNYNLEIEKLDSKHDSTLYRFIGSKNDINRAKDDGYFYNPEYESNSEPIRGEDQALKELIERLSKIGFVLDESVTPIRDNIMGGKHIQVINPNLKFPLDEAEGDEDEAYYLMIDDLKEVVELLDNFDDALGNEGYITFNFGPNKDNVITGGIDIRFRRDKHGRK